jgi:uncharacterized membrane protein
MAPSAASDPPRDRDPTGFERTLSTLLRVGVLTAGGFVLAGGIAYLLRHGGEHPDYARFTEEPSDLRTFTGILRAAAAVAPRGIIQLGLLVLIATPVLRVAFSLVAFRREGDRVYVAITAIVLLVLLLSLFGILPS